MLAMEKRFVTQCFPFRLWTTMLGITFTTAKCFYDQFVEKFDGTFLDFVHELCFDAMMNTLDDTHARPQPAAAGPDAGPAADRVPGVRSREASPTRAAAEHSIGRVQDIPGWVGAKQPLCSVCGKKTTRCCKQCSAKTVGACPRSLHLPIHTSHTHPCLHSAVLRYLRPEKAAMHGQAPG